MVLNWSYVNNIPFATNKPSVDQPDMKLNTESTFNILAVDHFGFNANNGGTHQQAQLLNVPGGSGAIPAGLQGNGFETLYSSATAGAGELWFVRGASPTGIQLTGPGTPSAVGNGSTFLPGGILMQWGTKNIASQGTATTVTFPSTFPNNVFSITFACVNTQGNSPSANNIYIKSGSITTSQFVATNSSSGGTTAINWIAIGN